VRREVLWVPVPMLISLSKRALRTTRSEDAGNQIAACLFRVRKNRTVKTFCTSNMDTSSSGELVLKEQNM
jgi:hypothetical protein